MKKRIIKFLKGTIVTEAKKTFILDVDVRMKKDNKILILIHVEIFGEIIFHKIIEKSL